MHWGERRYQYEDGSLTPEGREHYGIGEARERKDFWRQENYDEYASYRNLVEDGAEYINKFRADLKEFGGSKTYDGTINSNSDRHYKQDEDAFYETNNYWNKRIDEVIKQDESERLFAEDYVDRLLKRFGYK